MKVVIVSSLVLLNLVVSRGQKAYSLESFFLKLRVDSLTELVLDSNTMIHEQFWSEFLHPKFNPSITGYNKLQLSLGSCLAINQPKKNWRESNQVESPFYSSYNFNAYSYDNHYVGDLVDVSKMHIIPRKALITSDFGLALDSLLTGTYMLFASRASFDDWRSLYSDTLRVNPSLTPGITYTNNMIATRFYRRIDFRTFLDRKFVYEAKAVEECASRKVRGSVAIARCVNNIPFIYYSDPYDPTIREESFVFFREHEFAHFKLGHEGCGGKSLEIDSYKREYAADLLAGQEILRYDDGERIIDFVIGTFIGMNRKQDATHPSTISRAMYLQKNLMK